jgi:6-phosphogluconolactonase
MNLTRFDSPAQAADALAGQVAEALRVALATRAAASLAVPGGRTPVPFFHALRVMSLAWQRVMVTLTDERCVPRDDAHSNEALLRAQLLQERARSAQFVALSAEGGPCPALAMMPLPFDAVVLGMGEDGHFASLFPGMPQLEAALDPAAAPACIVARAPVAPVQRLSLNLAALVNSRRLWLFVTGAAKLAVLERAALPTHAGQWPVGALLGVRQPAVEVFWSP